MEKKKFDDKDETNYYDALKFCADIVWNGANPYLVINHKIIIIIVKTVITITLTFVHISPPPECIGAGEH